MIFAQLVEECRSLLEEFGKRAETPSARKKIRQYQGLHSTFKKKTGRDPSDSWDVQRALDRSSGSAIRTIRKIGRTGATTPKVLRDYDD
jgi:hypothetical protein